jgi:hypothetical protein
MQARAMLATLDLGEFLGPLGQLSWACLCCGRLVTAEREVAHLLRRITASVSLLDDGFGSGAVAEDDTDSSAPPRPHAERSSSHHRKSPTRPEGPVHESEEHHRSIEAGAERNMVEVEHVVVSTAYRPHRSLRAGWIAPHDF